MRHHEHRGLHDGRVLGQHVLDRMGVQAGRRSVLDPDPSRSRRPTSPVRSRPSRGTTTRSSLSRRSRTCCGECAHTSPTPSVGTSRPSPSRMLSSTPGAARPTEAGSSGRACSLGCSVVTIPHSLVPYVCVSGDFWNELTTRGIKTERRARRRQDQVPGARSGSVARAAEAGAGPTLRPRVRIAGPVVGPDCCYWMGTAVPETLTRESSEVVEHVKRLGRPMSTPW